MTTPMVNLESCKLCEDLTIVHENGALAVWRELHKQEGT